MPEILTLDELKNIRSRHQSADMATEAAIDAQQGWDESKINALLRSRSDIAVLHDFALRVLRDGEINGVKVAAIVPTIPGTFTEHSKA